MPGNVTAKLVGSLARNRLSEQALFGDLKFLDASRVGFLVNSSCLV